MARLITRINHWLVLLISTSWLVLGLSQLTVQGKEYPNLGVHPLPSILREWAVDTTEGDYFAEVKSITGVEYLIWSQFPVKVYLETGNNLWREKVNQAIASWREYLPLIEIEEETQADIIIKRSPPTPQIERNPNTGLLEISRARAGLTTYQFYFRDGILAHRMFIEINPGQNEKALLGTITHELGHALGIWGHSPIATDALYAAQSQQFLGISSRDINTLKKIYQQPTALGWLQSYSIEGRNSTPQQQKLIKVLY